MDGRGDGRAIGVLARRGIRRAARGRAPPPVRPTGLRVAVARACARAWGGRALPRRQGGQGLGSRAIVHLNPACTAGFRGLPVKIRPRGAEGPRPAPRQPGTMPATLRGRPRSKTLPTLPPATALVGGERRVSAHRGLRQQEYAGASAGDGRSAWRCIDCWWGGRPVGAPAGATIVAPERGMHGVATERGAMPAEGATTPACSCRRGPRRAETRLPFPGCRAVAATGGAGGSDRRRSRSVAGIAPG